MIHIIKKTPRPQERRFCIWYAALCNIKEAAIRAGYPAEQAVERGIAILQQADCQEWIHTIQETLQVCSLSDKVIAGLERLAFGSCNDAVSLAFTANAVQPEELEKLDLFSVTEIKRDKNGGVEVKLCDRQKAMERMLTYANSTENQSQASRLLSALTGENANDI